MRAPTAVYNGVI